MIAALLLMSAAVVGQPVDAGAAPRMTRSALIERARQAFDEGSQIGVRDPVAARRKFEEASDAFSAVVADGLRNSRLLYNLGNTHVRLGEIGRAIICYRRAEALDPGDANLAANLAFARRLRADQIEQAASRAALRQLLFWHYGTSTATRARLAVVLYVFFWALLAVKLLLRPAPAALTWSARGCAALALALLLSVAADGLRLGSPPAGVITTDHVILRKGNGEAYEPQFDHEFSQGVEFNLIEPRGDWLHIRLPDGKDGWIRNDQAELL